MQLFPVCNNLSVCQNVSFKRIAITSDSFAAGTGWANGEDDHFVAEALFDFTAQNEDEVSLRQGQSVNIAPKG